MKKVLFFCLIFLGIKNSTFAQKYALEGPNKEISVNVFLENGKMFYDVFRKGEKVLGTSALGIQLKNNDLSTNLKLEKVSAVKQIKDAYQLHNGKRLNNTYEANQKIWTVKNGSDLVLNIVFQLSNDGVAFKYEIPETKKVKSIAVLAEESSFHFPLTTKAWMQPMMVAKTGWESTNPSYEEYYQKEIAIGTPSTLGAGWVYPALFKNENTWLAVTEVGLDTNYCATRLGNLSPDGNYKVAFPDQREAITGKNVYPITSLPFSSPWRVIAIGDLKTLVESTLGTDLAAPAKKINTDFIKPGASSWSWVMLKDDSTVYAVQKRFIDYASAMKWPYCLIDADWDRKIGYDKMTELAAYAKSKDVGLLLWYNSAGAWNTVKYTPKDKLINAETRQKEFARLQEMGIKGIKVDFFGGDGQSVIKYYFDIFSDAAKYNLMVNCHGATIPRGWQRTWPNLMTMESIKGMEFITFDQKNADEEPYHATTIPFTRNLFDPMDFTPMSLYRIPKIKRRTNTSFELATALIYQSGIQHLAETPAGMEKMPVFVKDFLKDLPTTFDDTKFLDGYPGKYVIIARRVGEKWYVAGINADDETKNIQLDLSFIKGAKNVRKIEDSNIGENLEEEKLVFQNLMKVKISKNSGFVMLVE